MPINMEVCKYFGHDWEFVKELSYPTRKGKNSYDKFKCTKCGMTMWVEKPKDKGGVEGEMGAVSS